MNSTVKSIVLAAALAAAVFVSGCSDPAVAQTRGVTATWVLPTQYEDGTALPVSQIQRTCVTVARSASGAAIQPETCVNAPATTVAVPVPAALGCGTFFFRATVDATNGQRSAPSNPATRDFPCTPNPPTGLTVS